HRVHRRRHLGRRVGPQGGLLPHGGRRRRRRRPPGTDLPHPRPRGRVRPCRPHRRRALRQDDPQRHRVRDAAGLRRGLRPPRGRTGVLARPPPDRRPVAPRLRRALVAARPHRPGAREPGGVQPHQRLRRRLGRRPLDRAGVDQPRRRRPRDRVVVVRPLQLARRQQVRGPHRGRPAQRVRRPQVLRGGGGRRGAEDPGRPAGAAGAGLSVSQAQPDNPLAEGLGEERLAPPCVLVVFGASGDLTARKLMPALKSLADRRQLPSAFSVVGVARTELSDEDFQKRMREAVEDPSPAWDNLVKGFRYVAGDYVDDATFTKLAGVLDEVDKARGTGGSRVFYLATVPTVFAEVATALGKAGLNRPKQDDGFVRIVIEKPYGRDPRSALQLDAAVHAVFDESQVYRIDHYLGKETVQNVLALRFANAIFEPIWNRRYVDHVQVTVAESLGVGHRGGFYETAGAMRDIVQNHVMQVLALTLMEPPATVDATGIRDEKVKALRAVDIMTPDEVAQNVVRGQYDPGWVEGEQVIGYRQEEGVSPHSTTETYVAMRLKVDNWRWAGVPIFVRTGKRLPKRVTEVA